MKLIKPLAPLFSALALLCFASPAIAAPGDLSLLAGGPGGTDALGIAVKPIALTSDEEGDLIAADDRGTVRELDLESGTVTVRAGIGAFSGGPEGPSAISTAYNSVAALALSADGSVLMADQCGISALAAPEEPAIRFAGTCDEQPPPEFFEDGRPATETAVGRPTAIAVDAEGSVLYTSYGAEIKRIDHATGLVSTLADYNPDTAAGRADGVALGDAAFEITSLAFAADGDLLVGEAQNRVIRRVEAGADGVVGATDPVTRFAGTWDVTGFAGDGGPARQATLAYPEQIAPLADGRVVVTDLSNHRVRLIGADAEHTISTIAGGGSTPAADGVEALSAVLLFPKAVHAIGDRIFFSNYFGNRTYELDLAEASPELRAVLGNGTAGYSGDGGPAHEAQLDRPSDVAIALDGDAIVADTANNRLRRIDSASGEISTLAGNGEICGSGGCGEGGSPLAAPLGEPRAVLAAADGSIYWADSYIPLVWRITPGGIMERVAGDPEEFEGYSGDGGPARDATFTRINGLALSADESVLYVADSSRVRAIDLGTGIIETVAGTDFTEFYGDGGPALQAQLEATDVAVLSGGDLLIADGSSGRVRRVEMQGPLQSGTIDTWLGRTWPEEYENPGQLLGGDGETFGLLDAYAQASSLAVGPGDRVAIGTGSGVWLVEPGGPLVSRVAGDRWRGGFSGDSGPGIGTWVGEVGGLAFRENGDLVFSDPYNRRLRLLEAPRPLLRVDAVSPAGLSAGGSAVVRIENGPVVGPVAVAAGPGVTVSELVRESKTRTVARLTVAADAALGPRDLVLTTLGDGAEAVCSGCLTIAAGAPPVASPAPTRLLGELRAAKRVGIATLRRGLPVRTSAAQPGRLRVELRLRPRQAARLGLPRLLGRSTRVVLAAGPASVRVRLSAALARRLTGIGPRTLPAVLGVVLRSADGTVDSRSRPVVVAVPAHRGSGG